MQTARNRLQFALLSDKRDWGEVILLSFTCSRIVVSIYIIYFVNIGNRCEGDSEKIASHSECENVRSDDF